MVKIRPVALALLLGFSSIAQSNPLSFLMNQTEEPIDLYHQAECAMATLGAESYQLIETHNQLSGHPYFELKPATSKTIGNLADNLYKQGNFGQVSSALTRDPAQGLDEAVQLFNQIATLVKAPVSSSANLSSDEEKVAWMKTTLKSIKKKYKSEFKIQLKKESWGDWAKSKLILNRVTKHWNLKEFGSFANQAPQVMMAGAAMFQAKDLFAKYNPFAPKPTVAQQILSTCKSHKDMIYALTVLGIQLGGRLLINRFAGLQTASTTAEVTTRAIVPASFYTRAQRSFAVQKHLANVIDFYQIIVDRADMLIKFLSYGVGAHQLSQMVERVKLKPSLSDQQKYLLGSLGMQVGTMMTRAYLAGLEGDKAKLIQRQGLKAALESEKKFEKNAHQFAVNCPKEDDFSLIEGVHTPAVMKEMNFLSEWLQHPIRYKGKSRIAMMMYGEPGNGKDTIVRALSAESGAPLISIDINDFAPDKNGQLTSLISKLDAARTLSFKRPEKSAIIFFNEVDEILKNHKHSLHIFLNLLGQNANPHVRILYLFATNHIDQVDARILRPGRFKSKIYIGPPQTVEQRTCLIARQLGNLFGAAPEGLVTRLAQETENLSIAAIEESLVNTFNNAIMKSEMPDIESFLQEIANMKEVAYHSSKQIA